MIDKINKCIGKKCWCSTEHKGRVRSTGTPHYCEHYRQFLDERKEPTKQLCPFMVEEQHYEVDIFSLL